MSDHFGHGFGFRIGWPQPGSAVLRLLATPCKAADDNLCVIYVPQDVHDRALLYYRLFQNGLEVAESVVNPPKQPVSVFTDKQSSEAKDRIFDEFNSLAVVYRKVSFTF